jgi:SAM-dependent methyltransferase
MCLSSVAWLASEAWLAEAWSKGAEGSPTPRSGESGPQIIPRMTPAAWLTDHAGLLPARAQALDLACGRGRNTLWLAERCASVLALDRDAVAIDQVRADALARRLPVTAVVTDLESGALSLGTSVFDVVVVIHYLHRPLFPALIAALRPGGVLVYETFTRAQAARGKPTNPDFLLEEGELRRLVAPLEILDWREGEFEARDVASVIARRS